jgi:hypothetical protein
MKTKKVIKAKLTLSFIRKEKTGNLEVMAKDY